MEVVSTIWLAEHSILPENNRFTVQELFHRDEFVTLRSSDDRLLTAPAHILRVTGSPQSD